MSIDNILITQKRIIKLVKMQELIEGDEFFRDVYKLNNDKLIKLNDALTYLSNRQHYKDMLRD